ncbi:hypothetical protein GW935_03500 [Candidatus Falkowbacteria bacterium]|nr:hypothetical protein [Candidatus Falkowbacteria bacterium]
MPEVINALNLTDVEVVVFPQGTDEATMTEKLQEVVKGFDPATDKIIYDTTVENILTSINIGFKKTRNIDYSFSSSLYSGGNYQESIEDFLHSVKSFLEILNPTNKKIAIVKECLDSHLSQEMDSMFINRNLSIDERKALRPEVQNNIAEFINSQLNLNARVVKTANDVANDEFVIIDRHATSYDRSATPRENRLLLPFESAWDEASKLGKGNLLNHDEVFAKVVKQIAK